MWIGLVVVGVLVGVYGGFVWMGAPTVMQQQVAIGLFIAAAVLVAGGIVAEAVERLREKVVDQLRAGNASREGAVGPPPPGGPK
jgi:uncharacterized membrane protein